MNKKEVQERVLQYGKPLELSKFTWDEKNRVFRSKENDLVIDFYGISESVIKTGHCCTIRTGSYCTIDTEYHCTIDTGSYCTLHTRSFCTLNTGYRCTIRTGSHCTLNTGDRCTLHTGPYCTLNTGSFCTLNTGDGSTLHTGSYCTLNTGSRCVVVRRDVYEVIEVPANKTVQLFPYGTKGYLVDGMYQGEPHIIADGIVSKIISKKGNVYKVVNLGEDKQSWLIQDNGLFSHGETLKEARESLIYKIGDRDTSKYNDYTLDTVITKKEAIRMYRVITGACELGVKQFVLKQKTKKKKFTVKEIIDLTCGQYLNEKFCEFFKK